MGEKAAQKGNEPPFDRSIFIFACECLPGHQVEFGRAEAEPNEIIEEKIVKVIGTYQLFGALGDLPVAVGR